MSRCKTAISDAISYSRVDESQINDVTYRLSNPTVNDYFTISIFKPTVDTDMFATKTSTDFLLFNHPCIIFNAILHWEMKYCSAVCPLIVEHPKS